MKLSFLVRIASALALCAPLSAMAATSAKVQKIKLETIKPGKVQLDSRLGYVIVRLGPKSIGKGDAIPFGMMRLDSATQKGFDAEAYKADKELWRTVAVGVNAGRSFSEGDGLGTYVVAMYPGHWVISGVGQTCLSMGSYAFDVKAGELTDIGAFVTGRENGKSGAPELATSVLSPDLVSFGVAINIVMSENLAIRPVTNGPVVPTEFSALPLRKADLQADFRFDNSCFALVNRAASLPPIGHQPPLTKEAAAARIKELNPPEKPASTDAATTKASK
jgi:hypothetical protein